MTRSARSTPSRRASYVERSTAARSMPKPLVAFPWGSRSIRRTASPEMARRLARFTTVVVLPTPPFWFAQAIVRPTQRSPRTGFTETDSTIDGRFTSGATGSGRTAKRDPNRLSDAYRWLTTAPRRAARRHLFHVKHNVPLTRLASGARFATPLRCRGCALRPRVSLRVGEVRGILRRDVAAVLVAINEPGRWARGYFWPLRRGND